MAWRVSGALHAVPNVGEGWYLVTALLQPKAARAPYLVLLNSEQDGLVRESANLGGVDADDFAALSARDVFFRADEILHEDNTQIRGELMRFAAYLRCAIDAGRARSAVESMEGAAGANGRATLARTVDTLLRPTSHARSARKLPGIEELRSVARSLRSLHDPAIA